MKGITSMAAWPDRLARLARGETAMPGPSSDMWPVDFKSSSLHRPAQDQWDNLSGTRLGRILIYREKRTSKHVDMHWQESAQKELYLKFNGTIEFHILTGRMSRGMAVSPDEKI